MKTMDERENRELETLKLDVAPDKKYIRGCEELNDLEKMRQQLSGGMSCKTRNWFVTGKAIIANKKEVLAAKSDQWKFL